MKKLGKKINAQAETFEAYAGCYCVVCYCPFSWLNAGATRANYPSVSTSTSR